MNLQEYRAQIDGLDDEILRLFQRRMDTAAQVALYKKAQNIDIMQMDREREVLERMSSQCTDELAPYTKILFNTLMNLSKKYQEEILDNQ